MKAIVLAGGEGTRLRPLTGTRPKSLMPVADRPCIDYILRSLVTAGIKKIIIATHYLSDRLIKAIGDGLEYDASILYSFEETPAGTAGAVKRVEDFIDNTFVVTMGDIVADVDIGALVEFHRKRKAAATIALTRVDDPSQYGVAAIDENGRIKRFQEKPRREEAFSDLVNAGIYVLERRVIEFIPEDKMFDFSKHLFPLLLSKRIPVYGTVLDGVWMDIGRPGDLLRASLEMVSRQGKEMKIPGVRASGRVMLRDNVSVGEGAEIEGPCYIGSGVSIGAGAVVRRSCLQDGVVIGPKVALSDTLVLEGTTIDQNTEVAESVVASRCHIGEGSHITASVMGDDVVVGPNTTLREVTLPEVKG